MSKQEISQEMLRKIWIEYEEEIVEMLQKKMEEALEKKEKFEVEVPDLGDKFDIDRLGVSRNLSYEHQAIPEDFAPEYLRGLIFDTREEAERYDKERLLLFKIKKWAEIQNDGWEAGKYNEKYYIYYNSSCDELEIYSTCFYNYFLKLPYFENKKIAQACIDEFGDEILEVLL